MFLRLQGFVREEGEEIAGHVAGVILERVPAHRAGLVPDLPVEGDLVIAPHADDVAIGAAGNRDGGGDLVTPKALQLFLHLRLHALVFSIVSSSFRSLGILST